jgi:hypothetical protein
LLEYDDRYMVATEDVVKCSGLAVLSAITKSNNSRRGGRGDSSTTFDGTRFCRALADAMRRSAEADAIAGTVGGGGGGGGTTKTTATTTKMTEREVVFVNGDRVGGSTPTLDEVGIDLTEMAKDGRLDAVYGREYEIRMCLRTLGRRRKSNPCLIGEPGVGKTAIAEGVAQCLAGGYYVYGQDVDGDDGSGGSGGWGVRNPFRNKDGENNDNAKSVAGLSREEVDRLPPLPPCPRALQVRSPFIAFVFVRVLFFYPRAM